MDGYTGSTDSICYLRIGLVLLQGRAEADE
jgi:hypothetical protein